MYERHIGEEAIESVVDSECYDTDIEEYRGATHRSAPEPMAEVPLVDAAASVSRKRRRLFLSIVNVEESQLCELRFKNVRLSPTGVAHTLNAESILAENSLAAPDRVKIVDTPLSGVGERMRYDLPGHSATILEFTVD